MAVIKSGDLDRMQTLGRLVASKDNLKAWETAAEYLAIATLEGINTARLWLWFEEGARNNVEGQWHLDAIQTQLKYRVAELIKENR